MSGFFGVPPLEAASPVSWRLPSDRLQPCSRILKRNFPDQRKFIFRLLHWLLMLIVFIKRKISKEFCLNWDVLCQPFVAIVQTSNIQTSLYCRFCWVAWPHNHFCALDQPFQSEILSVTRVVEKQFFLLMFDSSQNAAILFESFDSKSGKFLPMHCLSEAARTAQNSALRTLFVWFRNFLSTKCPLWRTDPVSRLPNCFRRLKTRKLSSKFIPYPCHSGSEFRIFIL